MQLILTFDLLYQIGIILLACVILSIFIVLKIKKYREGLYAVLVKESEEGFKQIQRVKITPTTEMVNFKKGTYLINTGKPSLVVKKNIYFFINESDYNQLKLNDPNKKTDKVKPLNFESNKQKLLPPEMIKDIFKKHTMRQLIASSMPLLSGVFIWVIIGLCIGVPIGFIIKIFIPI